MHVDKYNVIYNHKLLILTGQVMIPKKIHAFRKNASSCELQNTLGEMEVVADSLTFKHLSEYVFAFQILNMYTVALILFFIFNYKMTFLRWLTGC